MSNLPEQPAWESGIHQLEESDRAKAGPGGVLNIPPTQLANRTRWLKSQLESISDYREYTFFKTESDPDGTISGLQATPSGKLFRVSQGEGDELAFKYFLNDNGIAVPDTVMIGQGSISNAIRWYSNSENAINDVNIGNIIDGGDFWIKNHSDSTISDEYINLGGTITPTGRKIPTQEYIDQKITSIQSEIDEVIEINSSLSPLVQSSEFIEVGKAGTQYEHITDSYILTDKDKNIIRCIRDGKMMLFAPMWFKEITSDKLIIAGVEIDPNGIPPSVLSENLLGLAKASSYLDPSVFADGGQFEAIKDQDILLDQNYNVLRRIRDGVQQYLLPVDTRLLSAQKFELKDAVEFTDSSLFSAGGRLEQWAAAGYEDIVCDKDGHLISYIKDSVRHHLISHKIKSVETDSLIVKGVDISETINYGTSKYLPYVQTVGGKSQVFALNKETSELVQITDGTANETNPSIDGTGLLTWHSDREDNVPGGRYFLDDSEIIRPLISRNILVGWGDSFMEQPVMMNKLHELTGLTTYNFGKSGLRSTAVAARHGGAPFYCMPDGGVIPASGSVNLLPNLPGPAASASNGAMTGIKCNLGGVDGTFNWSGTQAYFTRDVVGDAVSVPALLPLFVYPYTTSSVVGSVAAGTRYDLHDEAILLLTCGRNNTTLWWEPINDLKSIVGYLKPRGIRFAYMPQFTQASEIRGTDGYQRIHRINQEARDLCPENYVQIDDVDLLQNFKNHHNPASAQDVADIENDTTPTSLRTDALHPSQVLKSDALYIGAEVNAEFNYQFFKNKGWVL